MAVIFHVSNVDNQLQGVTNGFTFLDHVQDFDPLLDISVDITEHMRPGSNPITVLGWNRGPAPSNPWHFKYQITKDGTKLVDVDVYGVGFPEDNNLRHNAVHIIQM